MSVNVYYTSSPKLNMGSHPENLVRVEGAISKLRNALSYSNFPLIPELSYDEFKDLILLTHGEDKLQEFIRPSKVTCSQCRSKYKGIICDKCGIDKCFWELDGSTYCTSDVIESLIVLVSNLKACIDNLSEVKYHYLLVRPPGHHCYNKASGFCHINNVYLMACYAKTLGYKRIFILDWDFHHGDGTAKLVNGDESLFFVSIHAYGYISTLRGDRRVFPGSGSVDENTSNTKNIPLYLTCDKDRKKYTDKTYSAIMDNQVDSYIKNFNPDLILISNGLDAHKDDSLEGLNLTNEFYKYATNKLISYDVPLVFLLEGGYNPKVIEDVSLDIVNILND